MNLFLRYLDEATKKGIVTPITKNADYRDKFNYFLNESQIYIASIFKIPDTFTIIQNPIPNQIGDNEGFKLRQYLPGTDIVLTNVGTKSYYFEMDNVGTATIAINGTTAITINNTVKNVFTAHKGNITGATSTDIITITFTGSYPYNIRNTFCCAYPFPLDADVPDYTPFIEYDMPVNFMNFDTVILKGDSELYELYKTYKWEKTKKVVLRYDVSGSFDIHYFKYPTTILPTAADSTVLEVEDNCIELVVLQAAIRATARDNVELSSWLRSLFSEQIQNINNVEPEQLYENTVQTVYSMLW